MTSVGKIGNVLIKTYNLSAVLQRVILQLPAGLSVLIGLTSEEMCVYYTVGTLHAVAISKNIRLFVVIPLKAAD